MSRLVPTTPAPDAAADLFPARSALRAVAGEGLRLMAWSAYKRPRRTAAGMFGIAWAASALVTASLLRPRVVDEP